MNNEFGRKYKIFNTGHFNYVFFRDYLTVYKLEDRAMSDYFINQAGLSKKETLNIEKILKKANKSIKDFSIADLPGQLHSVCLIITRDCNLRCKYCYAYENLTNKPKMSFDIAKKSIDYLLNHSPDVQNYGIVFFGGEPLLEFKLIEEIVAYCKKEIIETRKKGVGYALTTNGIVLNDEIANFFKTHNFNIQVSIDGIQSEHDKNRVFPDGKGSYAIIFENLCYLKQHHIPFMIHSTFTPDIDLFETISELESLQNSFGYGLSIDVKGKSKNITNFEKANLNFLHNTYQKIIDMYYDKIRNNEKIYCQNVINGLLKIKNRVGKIVGCTAGDTMISVMPDGEILSCQNFQKVTECYEGHIDDFKQEDIKMRAHSIDESDICSECWMKYLCGGGCFYEKYLETDSVITPLASKCEVLKIQTEYFLKLYARIEEDNLIEQFAKNIGNDYQMYV